MVFCGIHFHNSPTETFKITGQIMIGKVQVAYIIELTTIVVDHYAEVFQLTGARIHNCLPNWALLQLTISGNRIHVKIRYLLPCESKTLSHAHPLSHRPGCQMYAW